jgi:hypothetical protein
MLIEEQRTVIECFDALHSGNLTKERLQQLYYALTVNRSQSRYAAWPEEDVAQAVEYIEELLPTSNRLKPQQHEAVTQRAGTAFTFPLGIDGPLASFAHSLPYRPYVSNDLENYGLRIVSRGQADLFKYIQHNPPAACHWLVFDCDYPGAIAKVAADGLPLPNFVATNPANGHSHLFYGLEDPVCVSEAGQRKPIFLLRRIEFQLREQLGADVGYQGFISKNLLHEHWHVQSVREQLWKLLEFQEFLTLPKRLPKRADNSGLGRNVTLFNETRRVAYAAVLGYRLTGNKDGFRQYIHGVASAKNLGFPAPLYAAEVRSIVKSIVNWTWTKYTKHTDPAAFSERQAARGKLGGLAKGQANTGKRSEALEMATKGQSQRAIAAILGVSQKTISNWLSK